MLILSCFILLLPAYASLSRRKDANSQLVKGEEENIDKSIKKEGC